MKRLIFPLLSCALCIMTGCASVGAERPVIKSVSVGENREWDNYSSRSFEPPKACEGFTLTESDVFEFFQKARYISPELEKSYASKEPPESTPGLLDSSRCIAQGDMVLQNGKEAYWGIGRARYGWFYFMDYSEDKNGVERIFNFYCDQCVSKAYYSPMGEKLEDWRPVLKSVVVEENGARSGNRDKMSEDEIQACSEFTVSETDVLEFFKVARPASRREYGHDLDVSPCYASGRAMLQNGETVEWVIDSARRGALFVNIGGEPAYYYGYKWRIEEYPDVCNFACMDPD